MSNGFENDFMLDFISEKYGLEAGTVELVPLGNGLINTTWKLIVSGRELVLQKVNNNVFANPVAIDENLYTLSNYLKSNSPEYNLIAPVRSVDGTTLVKNHKNEFFRVFPYVSGSHSLDVVETPSQAYEASRMFGQFTSVLSGLDAQLLHSAIPDFHNLELRFSQLNESIKNGNKDRIREGAELTGFLLKHSTILSEYQRIRTSADFRLRVTHHDTKISNVLFDKDGGGICVIDLDTVMPGYFISDVGDMMRTYLSPVGEEEADFSGIEVRDEFYRAIVSGYSGQMQDVLSPAEQKSFFYAGTFIIYMQAIRFLTDYFNDDVYYGSKYPTHNFVRAGNQATLLQRLLEKQKHFSQHRPRMQSF